MALTVLLVVLATYRVTHLLTTDAFPPIEDMRARITDRWGDGSWQSYLSECAWCVSVYVGAGIVGASLLAGVDLVAPVWVWLTASAVTGLIATVEP